MKARAWPSDCRPGAASGDQPPAQPWLRPERRCSWSPEASLAWALPPEDPHAIWHICWNVHTPTIMQAGGLHRHARGRRGECNKFSIVREVCDEVARTRRGCRQESEGCGPALRVPSAGVWGEGLHAYSGQNSSSSSSTNDGWPMAERRRAQSSPCGSTVRGACVGRRECGSIVCEARLA